MRHRLEASQACQMCNSLPQQYQCKSGVKDVGADGTETIYMCREFLQDQVEGILQQYQCKSGVMASCCRDASALMTLC